MTEGPVGMSLLEQAEACWYQNNESSSWYCLFLWAMEQDMMRSAMNRKQLLLVIAEVAADLHIATERESDEQLRESARADRDRLFEVLKTNIRDKDPGILVAGPGILGDFDKDW